MDQAAATGTAGAVEWLAVLPGTFGTIGLVLYIGSYFALMLGLVRGDGYVYAALNLIAALAIIVSLIDAFNLYAMLGEVAWVVLSIIGMVRIYLVQKYLRLTEDERAAARRLVPGLAKDRQRKLLRLGTWAEAAPGTVLACEGEPVEHLVFVADGLCRIEIGGALVASLGAGALVGEMTYHTGLPATATVIVETPARLLSFQRDALNGFLRRNEDIRAAIEQSWRATCATSSPPPAARSQRAAAAPRPCRADAVSGGRAGGSAQSREATFSQFTSLSRKFVR